MVRTDGVGKYGRVIATVESLIRLDDTDIGDALVKAGLARPWPPKPGETWCPAGSP
jgi:endonuclease YncB( thermonuclease family)